MIELPELAEFVDATLVVDDSPNFEEFPNGDSMTFVFVSLRHEDGIMDEEMKNKLLESGKWKLLREVEKMLKEASPDAGKGAAASSAAGSSRRTAQGENK